LNVGRSVPQPPPMVIGSRGRRAGPTVVRRLEIHKTARTNASPAAPAVGAMRKHTGRL